MAVAVGSLIQYVLVKKGEEYFVVAGERSEAVFKVDFEVVRKFDGSEIVGIEYEPLFENSLVQKTAKKSWFVTEGDFVTTTDGTGIVHIANMYGEDDYQLGLRYDLPQIPMVSAGGMYNENAPNFLQGIYYKKGEKLVKDDLVSRELLFLVKIILTNFHTAGDVRRRLSIRPSKLGLLPLKNKTAFA